MAENYNNNDNEVKVTITADTTPLKEGLNNAENDIKSFAKNNKRDVKIGADSDSLKGTINEIKDGVFKGVTEGISKSLGDVSELKKQTTQYKAAISGAVLGAVSEGIKGIDKIDVGSGILENIKVSGLELEAAYKAAIADAEESRAELYAELHQALIDENTELIAEIREETFIIEENIRGIEEALSDIKNFNTASLNSVQQILDQGKSEMSGNTTTDIDDIKYAEDIAKMIPRRIRLAANAIKGVIKLLGLTKAAIIGIAAGVAAVIALIKIAKSMIDYAKKAVEAVGEAIKFVNKQVLNIISLFGKGSLAILNGYIKAIKGIGTVLKGIVSLATKAISTFSKLFSMFSISYKEGIDRMYQWSALNNGVFRKSLDGITSSVHAIENSLAAMAAPIINKLAPVIDVITDKVLVLTNAVAKLFAQLSGASTYTKVTKAATKFADANDKAAKSLKRVLLNIDELNKLEANDTNEILSSFSEVTTELETLGKKKSDFQIGVDFGKQLLDSLNNINWTQIKAKAGKVGKQLADVINGIFYVGGLGKKFGETLAEAVNTAFEFLKKFVFTIDVSAIAHLIGQIVNGFFDKVDFADHGRTIGKGIQNVFDFVYETLLTIDTEKIGTQIATLFNNIFYEVDGDKIGLTLAEVVNKAFDYLHGYLSTIDVTEIITDITNAITSFFSGIDWDKINLAINDLVNNITTAINTFLNDDERVEKIGIAIRNLVSSGLNLAFSLITGINWEKLAKNIGSHISSALDGLDTDKIATGIMTAFDAAFQILLNTPWDKLAKFAIGLFNKILVAIPEELKRVSPTKVANQVADALNIIIDDMSPQNIAGTVNAFISWVGDFWQTVIKKVNWKELVDKICQAIRDVDWAKALEVVWAVIVKCWVYTLIFKGKVIFNLVHDIVEDIKQKFNDNIESIEGVGKNIAKWIVTGIENVIMISNPFAGLLGTIHNLLEKINQVKRAMSTVNDDDGYVNGGPGVKDRVKTYASGGVVYHPTAAIVGEYAGASSNPEIITPENKMREIFNEGNSALANVYILVGRQIIEAIERQDLSISIGDNEIGYAAARANNNYKRLTGQALII